jgi:kumamolisin
MRLQKCLLTAACVVGILGVAAAKPYPRSHMPPAVDLGLTQNVAPRTEVTLTVALKLQNTNRLQALLKSIYTPGSANYRHFLTSQQFAAQFGPSPATVAQLTRHFQADGFTVTRSAITQLKITGSIQALQAEFGVKMHEYQEDATVDTPAYHFRAPDREAKISSAVAGSVEGVLGFSTQPRFRPNLTRAGAMGLTPMASPAKGSGAPATPDPPGAWTVTDFSQYYDVDPLYSRGVSGSGETVGIMTLASFTPSDAYTYWQALGLTVNSGRITEVPVDGGSGSPSYASGSMETTLDVEQSGGIAPGANVLVYEGQNSAQGFVDVFAQAADDDVADTVSVSWGEWEWFDILPIQYVTDPTSGENATTLRALNDVLLQMALQGQSVFCAAGDSGGYDANGFFPVPLFSKAASVDDPAVQPFITTMGGTTLPGTQLYGLPNGNTFPVNIRNERAWSWDYLVPLCKVLGYDPVSCGIFPAGGGGGVSSYVWRPFYQWFTHGIDSTPGAKLEDISGTPLQSWQTLPVVLPKGFPGRNVPDVSLNSDPDTGYVILYTVDSAPNCDSSGVCTFWGGTSFAAPQMNGVTSLFVQALHHRIGLLNFPLYAIGNSPEAYRGHDAPLRDITNGDNWYWRATPGYDQATGLGVPDVANLLEALRNPFF